MLINDHAKDTNGSLARDTGFGKLEGGWICSCITCWRVPVRSTTVFDGLSNRVLEMRDPPQSTIKSRHSVSFSPFLEYSSVSTSLHKFHITGNFNIHVDDLTDSNAIQFLLLLDHANWTQQVSFPIHQHSHTLDLLITSANSPLSPTVISLPTSPTEHFPITENYFFSYCSYKHKLHSCYQLNHNILLVSLLILLNTIWSCWLL